MNKVEQQIYFIFLAFDAFDLKTPGQNNSNNKTLKSLKTQKERLFLRIKTEIQNINSAKNVRKPKRSDHHV